MTDRVDSHHDHGKQPQLAQVGHRPWIDHAIRQQRQDYGRGSGEQQGVVRLLFDQHVLHEAVHTRLHR